eukprot:gene14486-22175_t
METTTQLYIRGEGKGRSGGNSCGKMQYAAPRTEKPLLSGIFEDVRQMAKQAGLFGPKDLTDVPSRNAPPLPQALGAPAEASPQAGGVDSRVFTCAVHLTIHSLKVVQDIVDQNAIVHVEIKGGTKCHLPLKTCFKRSKGLNSTTSSLSDTANGNGGGAATGLEGMLQFTVFSADPWEDLHVYITHEGIITSEVLGQVVVPLSSLHGRGETCGKGVAEPAEKKVKSPREARSDEDEAASTFGSAAVAKMFRRHRRGSGSSAGTVGDDEDSPPAKAGRARKTGSVIFGGGRPRTPPPAGSDAGTPRAEPTGSPRPRTPPPALLSLEIPARAPQPSVAADPASLVPQPRPQTTTHVFWSFKGGKHAAKYVSGIPEVPSSAMKKPKEVGQITMSARFELIGHGTLWSMYGTPASRKCPLDNKVAGSPVEEIEFKIMRLLRCYERVRIHLKTVPWVYSALLVPLFRFRLGQPGVLPAIFSRGAPAADPPPSLLGAKRTALSVFLSTAALAVGAFVICSTSFDALILESVVALFSLSLLCKGRDSVDCICWADDVRLLEPPDAPQSIIGQYFHVKKCLDKAVAVAEKALHACETVSTIFHWVDPSVTLIAFLGLFTLAFAASAAAAAYAAVLHPFLSWRVYALIAFTAPFAIGLRYDRSLQRRRADARAPPLPVGSPPLLWVPKKPVSPAAGHCYIATLVTLAIAASAAGAYAAVLHPFTCTWRVYALGSPPLLGAREA